MMEYNKKTRKKIELGYMFKEVGRDDVYFPPHTVIHDLTIKEPGHEFSKPLSAYINDHYTYTGVLPASPGDLSTYDQPFLTFVGEFREFLQQEFEWRKRKVTIVIVEKDPWIYKRVHRLIEINDEDVLNTLFGILACLQKSYGEFVFTLLKPIMVTKEVFPGYPYKVSFNTKTNELIYIKS